MPYATGSYSPADFYLPDSGLGQDKIWRKKGAPDWLFFTEDGAIIDAHKKLKYYPDGTFTSIDSAIENPYYGEEEEEVVVTPKKKVVPFDGETFYDWMMKNNYRNYTSLAARKQLLKEKAFAGLFEDGEYRGDLE